MTARKKPDAVLLESPWSSKRNVGLQRSKTWADIFHKKELKQKIMFEVSLVSNKCDTI